MRRYVVEVGGERYVVYVDEQIVIIADEQGHELFDIVRKDLEDLKMYDTHRALDRINARLRKLIRILRGAALPVHSQDHETIAPPAFNPFKDEINILSNISFILERYKNFVKRKRIYVLKFVYPHIRRAIENICEKAFVWRHPSHRVDYVVRVLIHPYDYPPTCECMIDIDAYYPSYERWERMCPLKLGELREIVHKHIKRRYPKYYRYNIERSFRIKPNEWDICWFFAKVIEG